MRNEQYHILIVDDNEDILTMLKMMLEHNNYQISIQDNTNNIKALISSLMPDVILMDKLLSGSDGCDVCRQIKTVEKIKRIPIIMISAHAHAGEECLSAGADFFLEKPFEMDNLLQTVAKASRNGKVKI
jgi:CheY-like chemotaxis protein